MLQTPPAPFAYIVASFNRGVPFWNPLIVNKCKYIGFFNKQNSPMCKYIKADSVVKHDGGLIAINQHRCHLWLRKFLQKDDVTKRYPIEE